MIKLQRLNVVKEVDSEDKAKRLEDLGFKRLEEQSKPPVELVSPPKKEKAHESTPEGSSPEPEGSASDGQGENQSEGKTEESENTPAALAKPSGKKKANVKTGGETNAPDSDPKDNSGGNGQPEAKG